MVPLGLPFRPVEGWTTLSTRLVRRACGASSNAGVRFPTRGKYDPKLDCDSRHQDAEANSVLLRWQVRSALALADCLAIVHLNVGALGPRDRLRARRQHFGLIPAALHAAIDRRITFRRPRRHPRRATDEPDEDCSQEHPLHGSTSFTTFMRNQSANAHRPSVTHRLQFCLIAALQLARR